MYDTNTHCIHILMSVVDVLTSVCVDNKTHENSCAAQTVQTTYGLLMLLLFLLLLGVYCLCTQCACPCACVLYTVCYMYVFVNEPKLHGSRTVTDRARVEHWKCIGIVSYIFFSIRTVRSTAAVDTC